jgi:hypothetical protein
MKVYVLTQEWQNYDDHEHNIIGVYDSLEKAQEEMEKLYQDDLNWIDENMDYDEETELDENINNDKYTYVQYEEWWSENIISEFELQ